MLQTNINFNKTYFTVAYFIVSGFLLFGSIKLCL